MASIIVLIRHGKAVSASQGMEDLARPLTSFGRAALEANLPDSLFPLALTPEYIQGETQVWSSGAYRAMETAEIAASILGVPEINESMCLLAQDFDEFISDVRNSEADVVVAVGHEPFMGQAAQRLCGTALPFKTGAVAIFDISEFDGTPIDSSIRCFNQGPRTERWKTLHKMDSAILQAVARVEETMAGFLAAPEDVEALHDFRVSIRTLRSMLGFVQPYMNRKRVKAVQSDLRNLVVKTSRLRELDVFMETVRESQHCNEELLAAIAKLRKKECRKLLKEISGKKNQKAIRAILSNVGRIGWKQHIDMMGISSEDVAARFDLYCVKFEAAYLNVDLADVEATHELRKLAKKVRYASREFGSIIGEDALVMAEDMKGMQDLLGALCDARVNCDIIDSLPRKKFSDAADVAVAAIKQDQMDAILAILEEEAAAMDADQIEEAWANDFEDSWADDFEEAMQTPVEEEPADNAVAQSDDEILEEALEVDSQESFVDNDVEQKADDSEPADVDEVVDDITRMGEED